MSDTAVSQRRSAYFLAGLAVVAVALSPPLDAAAGRHLSVHRVQHLLLMLAAAPLLVAARPVAWLMESLPVGVRARVGRTLHHPAGRAGRRLGTQPVVVLSLAVGGFWAWHLPRAYDAALGHPVVHMLEHATFLAGSFLFWAIVLDPGPRRRLSLGATCGFVFAAMLVNIWLAAVLAFATTPMYPTYIGHDAAAALSDQQLAGVIMWLPADVVYFVTLLTLLRKILRDLDRRHPRRVAPEEVRL
ncbi:MAG TPA: cytochrome c oxidase assembly protein [Acidimicrobiia bacterium]|nr:cytochrome c oxidase assembly protein [Acidimicrobiia bacterium]